MRLDVPDHVGGQRERLEALADRIDALYGPALRGLALAGSAGRGTADRSSDLDLLVILDDGEDPSHLDELRAADLDLIPLTAPVPGAARDVR